MKKSKRKIGMPKFVIRHHVFDKYFHVVSVRADTFQKARRKFRSLQNSFIEVQGDILTYKRGNPSLYNIHKVFSCSKDFSDIELEMQCPHCGMFQYRHEKKACWHFCEMCHNYFSMFLNDDCGKCPRDIKLDCLLTPSGLIT